VILEEDEGLDEVEDMEIDSGGLQRRPAGESRRLISWIWHVSSTSSQEKVGQMDESEHAHSQWSFNLLMPIMCSSSC
jgi:hypothetical protein